MLCDECLVLWNHAAEAEDDDDSDNGLDLRLLSAADEEFMLATMNVSAEEVAKTCKGHRHAVCETIGARLGLGPMTPERLSDLLLTQA